MAELPRSSDGGSGVEQPGILPTRPGQVFTVRNSQGYETSFEAAKWGRLQNNVLYPPSMRDRIEDMQQALMFPDDIIGELKERTFIKDFTDRQALTIRIEVDENTKTAKVILPMPQNYLGSSRGERRNRGERRGAA